jgi:hypothetical protein
MSTTRPPQQQGSALTCDCHFLICGPYDRFPLDAGRHPGMDPAPEAGLLFDQSVEWVPDAATRQRTLVENAATLYGF